MSELHIAGAMFSCFFILVFVGVPISFSIGMSTIVAALMMTTAIFTADAALITISQKMFSGLDSFAILAIPFFILAGTFMNSGGIAQRLINFASVLVGRVPGSLWHVNVLSNSLFGSISGSAVAAAAAMGKTMSPMQAKAGYDPAYSTAVNVSSCISGLLIPPSNILIIYALTASGVSVATLFMAGYVPGILLCLSVMLVSFFIAKKRNYPLSEKVSLNYALKVTLDAIPSLFLIIIVMGGILGGFFTATEASAIAVVYTFILSVLIYGEIKFKDIPKLVLESVVTTSIVLLLIAVSVGMSWAMTNADIPYMISDALANISKNPMIILLIINILLLIVGIFMDMTPAVLIFTPMLLPVVRDFGMDPVHFGIMMVFNLCIGLCTPPVGSALFIGCSVSGVKIQDLIRPMLPFYLALVAMLLLVTYVPQISLFLPRLFNMM